jgi:hypothetical protein
MTVERFPMPVPMRVMAARSTRRTSARPSLPTLLLCFFVAACAARAPTAGGGALVEEFEGFPIYHGDPGMPYEVLGPVYSPDAAARGTSPMKRAAVAEAKRLGADAIVLASPLARQGTPSAAATTNAKWPTAVAVRLSR